MALSVVALLTVVCIAALAASETYLERGTDDTQNSTLPSEPLTSLDRGPAAQSEPVRAQGPSATLYRYDPQLQRPSDIASWDRENSFMMRQQAIRQREAPQLLGFQIPSPEDTYPDARRILVVGDSYVFGFGIYDLDKVWQRNLATKLAFRYGSGSTYIQGLAKGGTSLFTYLEYLTAENIAAFDPDLIVLGVLPNDWYPDGSESLFCPPAEKVKSKYDRCMLGSWYNTPSYLRCLRGEENPVGWVNRTLIRPFFPRTAATLQRQLCNPDRFGDGVGIPTTADVAPWDRVEGPPSQYLQYLPFLTDELRRVKRAAGAIPILVYPSIIIHNAEIDPAVRNILKVEGYDIIPNPHTRSLLSRHANKYDQTLWINPADQHPNSILSEAYARDVFEYLEEHYPSTPVKGKKFDMELLSNVVPSSLRISKFKSGDYRVSYHPDDLNDPAIKGATVTQDYRGLPKPPQKVPCAEVGRPYAQVVLNPDVLTAGVDVRIIAEKLPAEGLLLYPISYLDDGTMTLGPATPLTSQAFRLRFDTTNTGFVVTAPFSGCPLGKQIDLPGFVLRLTTNV